MYDYKANDLESDELLYELEIRGQYPRENTTYAQLKRDLRHLLKNDRTNNPTYQTDMTIDDELPIVSARLIELKKLILIRPNSKTKSRLIHLRNRIFRAIASDENAAKTKSKLLNEAEMLLKQYFSYDPALDSNVANATDQQIPTNKELTTVISAPRTSENVNPSNIVIREGNFFVVDPSLMNFNTNNFANFPTFGFPRQNSLFTPERGPIRLPANVLGMDNSTSVITPAIGETNIEANVYQKSTSNHISNNQLPVDTGAHPRYSNNTTIQNRTAVGSISQDQSTRTSMGRTSSPTRFRSEFIQRMPQYEFPEPNANIRHEIPKEPLVNPTPVASDRTRAPRSEFRQNLSRSDPDSTPINMDSFTRALNDIRFQNSSENVRRQLEQPPVVSENFREELRSLVRGLVRDTVVDYFNDMDQMPTPSPLPRQPTVQNPPRCAQNSANFQPVNNTTLGNRVPHRQSQSRNDSPAPNNEDHNVFPNNQINDQYFNMGLRTKIEKWQVQFSGDSKSLSVSDFVRQITILARANRVSKEQLLRQSYLFFTGEERRWYFTYYDRFQTWDHLVYYMNLYFENPNKDKSIEEAIRERKQKGNERFSQYLADMERLFQSLSYPTNENEKLKWVYENMKMSYKRRLALTPVQTLGQLTEYCYSFDSLEPSLFTPISQRTHPINMIENSEIEELENESDEEVNALFKSRKNKNLQSNSKETTKESDRSETKQLNICWNCREEGHWYTNCSMPRSVFCYVCGEPSFTIKTCPNKHFRRAQSPKN